MTPAHRLRAGRLPGRAGEPAVALALGLIWAVLFSLLGWLAMLSVLPYQGYGLAAMVVAFIVLPAIGLWVVAKAGSQGGGFLVVIVLLVVLVSDLSVRGASTGIDAQSAVKFAIWVSGLLLLPWRFSVVRYASKDLPTFAVLLFGLWALVGTVYSITPLYTFAAGVGFLGLWVIAVVFATSIDPQRGLLWLTLAFFLMSAASLLLYFVAPEIAMVVTDNSAALRLGGIFFNANSVGGVAALALLLAFIACFYLPVRTTLLVLLLVVPVCGACLVLSQSRSTMLGLLAGISVVLLRRHPLLMWPTVLISASYAAAVYAYPGIVDDVVELVSRAGRVSSVFNFTGRTEIWHFMLSKIAEAPVVGHGFGATKELVFEGAYGWTSSSAHNMWLQAWVTTGGVGLTLVLANQLGSLRAIVKEPLPIRDGLWAYVVVVGFFESGPVGPSVNLLTFVWVWATAMSLRPPSLPR